MEGFFVKIFIIKNEEYQTPQILALLNIISTIQGDKVAYGADDATRTRNQLLGRQ